MGYFEGCPIEARKSPNVCQGSFDVMDPCCMQASPVNVPLATGEAVRDFFRPPLKTTSADLRIMPASMSVSDGGGISPVAAEEEVR